MSVSLSVRYSISGVSLSAVLGAVLCCAWQNPLKLGLLSVPPGLAGCSGFLALLSGLDSSAAAGLEQVCTHYFTQYSITHCLD